MQSQSTKSKRLQTAKVKSQMLLQGQQNFGQMAINEKQRKLLSKLSEEQLNEVILRGLVQAETDGVQLLKARHQKYQKSQSLA